jgi:fucose 4-O-acetylase-like acetyltransferase
MKVRDVYFDNLKTILIFLVVLGHFVNLSKTIPIMGAINNVIYSFHMPIFIFISGYFSKNITSQRAAEIENVLYPFVIFQLLNLIFTKLTGLGHGAVNIFKPFYQNWYLLGLLFWRVAIPYYNFFNIKVSFFLTIVLTFIIGFFEDFNTFLGLYRIIYFFPIFILGYYCSDLKALLDKYSKYKHYFIITSLVGLILIFLASFFKSDFNLAISFAYSPYSNYRDLDFTFYLRLIGFFSSLVISIGLLYLVPNKKFKMTYLGENTLSIFLLHMFFVFPIHHYLSGISTYLMLVVALVSSVIICVVCSTSVVNEMVAPLMKLNRLKLLVQKYR